MTSTLRTGSGQQTGGMLRKSERESGVREPLDKINENSRSLPQRLPASLACLQLFFL